MKKSRWIAAIAVAGVAAAIMNVPRVIAIDRETVARVQDIREIIKSVALEEGVPEDRLLDIACAESEIRQFEKPGKVLRGKVNPKDVGVFQINEKFWLADAVKLKLNIYQAQGNVEMAAWIYKHYGDSPWNWSKKNWDRKKCEK